MTDKARQLDEALKAAGLAAVRVWESSPGRLSLEFLDPRAAEVTLNLATALGAVRNLASKLAFTVECDAVGKLCDSITRFANVNRR
jgi:hypothetical protein